MPVGNISGLKMISVAALSSSASTRSSVNVPASTCSRSAGQPNARVVGRIARFPNDDDQTPAERLPMDLRDELTEQVILVRWGGASRLERLERFQDPGPRSRLARRIREKKRIQPVEGGVAESRPLRFGGDLLEHLDRFRMALFKCLHLGGIGLSGRGILLECKQA